MNVLIVGLGRMGERYLTVLKKVYSDKLNLHVVDPIKEEVEGATCYKNMNDLPINTEIDLAIDARPNKGRLELLQNLVERKIPRVIVEKPHANSLEESQKMTELMDRSPKTKVMVPFFRNLSPLFDPKTFASMGAGSLQSITVTSGAIGIGCNGVHLIDIASRLFESNPQKVYGNIEIGSIESPRGADFSDDSGVIVVNYPNNKKFIINVVSGSSQGINTVYSFENGKVLVNEQQEPHWKWYKRADENLELPNYRTHMEKEIQPPMDYKLDLFALIETGIGVFLETPDQVPNLKQAHQVLQTVALAQHSSATGQSYNLNDSQTLDTLKTNTFNFT